MTTYLLHGGRTSQQNSMNDSFFKKFTDLVNKESVKILLCYFSRERKQWDTLIERDSSNIKKNTNKKVEIEVAENPKDLIEKLVDSDVLYVAGGDAKLIEPLYKDLVSIKEKLEGKVFAGSSMGTFFASEHYVLSFDSQDSNSVHNGLGLFSIQTLCHWDIEDEKEMKLQLLSESSDLPILVLNEFEHVVFYN